MYLKSQSRNVIKMLSLLFCLIVFFSALPAGAAEYFVGKQGNDANNGQGRDKAFVTIQKGVSALQPGDTLTIGPGEYLENVKLEKFGNPDHETLIRAGIPGTVLLRGDVDAPAFSKVDGRRFVYVADFDGKALSAHETDTMTRLLPSADIDSLEFKPGSWYQDEVAKKLYVSSTDFQAPDRHHYTVGLLKDNGFKVMDSQRVVIDGLASSGFMTSTKNPVLLLPVSGFLLNNVKNSIIRRCSAYFNEAGICIRNEEMKGSGNLVEDCRAYGNQQDGIVSNGPNNDTIKNSCAFLNVGCGIQFYGGRIGNVLFSNNLSWGNSYGDFRMKGSGLSGEDKFAVAERCISMERFDVFNITHCIVGGPNSYRGDTPPDCIVMPNDPVFKDREFADAVNFDFRLQATSPFRQPGKDYQYKGPYPFEPNIYYVKTGGNDSLDGLSMTNAWNTLGYAFKKLKPGDTLYIAGGRYSSDAPLTAKKVKIRGRGADPVVIDGDLQIVNSEDVLLERLHFTGAVRIEKGREITYGNCSFSSDKSVEAVDVNGLNVSHGVFKSQLKLKGCSKVSLSGNIYAASPAVQVDKMENIIYSSYNSYPKTANCWELGGKATSLEELQKTQEANSRIMVPELAESNGVLTLKNAYQFVGSGPLGSAIGTYREWQIRFLQLVGPFVNSVTDSTANLEWWTSLPADLELRWGDTPECTNKVAINQNSFYSYSLIGLEPGKKYYLKIKPTQISATADPGRRFRLPSQEWATTEFTTAQKADTAPKTYYVSNDGNNGNNGLSRETAWKSIQHAADTVRPCDTVLIGGGTYPGTVYFRVTGEKDKPITFKAIPGEKVMIDGMGETLKNGLVLYGKHYYNFDSLYVQAYCGGDGSGALLVNGGSHIQTTRCYYSGGWGTGIAAGGCSDMLVKNCVFMHSMGSTTFGRCPNLRLENNVFISPLISHLSIGNDVSDPAFVTNNIFCENTRGKAQICFILFSPSTVESNNCFYLRWPENERGVMNYLTLPEYRVVKQTDSFAANPMMPGALGWRQGWGPGGGDFNALFATNPEVVKRGIGLQPEAFRDFHFKMTDWPYDVVWAEKMLAAEKVAEDLVKSEKDADALVAYTKLAASTPMSDRLKSALLDQAALCANRLKQYDQAMALAKQIPLKPLSARRQMAFMVEQQKYSELLAEFSGKAMGGSSFHLNWFYPELEDVMADLFYYRSIAYTQTNNLTAAEADLKTMVDKRAALGYSPGEAIHELALLRLGDFNRTQLKDDKRAMEAYSYILDRTMIAPYRTNVINKPAFTGASESLVAATKAASEILRKQGKEDEALKLQFSMLKAQSEALASLGKHEEAIAKLKEALGVKGISAAQKEECEKKINELQLSAWKKTANIDKVTATTPMTEEIRQNLIKAAGNENPGIRQTALNTIIAFAPITDEITQVLIKACADKDAGIRQTAVKKIIASVTMTEDIKNLLSKSAKDEDEAVRKMAARAIVTPEITRIRLLAQGGKWQDLITEFKETDLAGWQDKSLAGEALYIRGRGYYRLKDGEKAFADIKKSLELAPGNSSCMELLADNYRDNMKDEQKALDTYLQYLKEFEVNYGGESLRVALNAAGMLCKQGKTGQALEVLKRYDLKKITVAEYRKQFEDTIKACGK